MTYTTPRLLAAHAGKRYETVRLALKAAGLMTRERGIKGARIPVQKANRFLAKQWPGTPLMKEGE